MTEPNPEIISPIAMLHEKQDEAIDFLLTTGFVRAKTDWLVAGGIERLRSRVAKLEAMKEEK